MRARLGDVLYLAGCVLSLLWFTVVVIVVATASGDWWNVGSVIEISIFLIAPAVLFWSIGTACLYVLRGHTQIGIFPAIAPRHIARFLGEASIAVIAFAIFCFVVWAAWFVFHDLALGHYFRGLVNYVFDSPLITFPLFGSMTVGLTYVLFAEPWREMKWRKRIVRALVYALYISANDVQHYSNCDSSQPGRQLPRLDYACSADLQRIAGFAVETKARCDGQCRRSR